jgi:drug/metabolite transporter (DMT)-like permease
MKEKTQRLATLALIAVTVIWGSGFIATQFAIDSQMPTPWIMMIRFLVGALCIFLFFRKRIAPTPKRTVLHGMVAGFILYIAFYTQTVGQGRTTISNAAFLTATNIIMIPLFAVDFHQKAPAIAHFRPLLINHAGRYIANLSGRLFPFLYQGGLDCAFMRPVFCHAHHLA